MDEVLQLLLKFMQQVEQNFNALDDAEANQITQFLQEVMGFLSSPTQEVRQESPISEPISFSIPPSAELLWILAGGKPDAFVNYLRTFPDPSLNALVRNPEVLKEIIERLSRSMPQGEQESVEGIQKGPYESSNIYGFQYNPSTGTLKVRFQSGSIYQYKGVPPAVFKIFQQGAVPAKTSGQNRFGKWWIGKIPSTGASFYQLIKMGGYPYRRLT